MEYAISICSTRYKLIVGRDSGSGLGLGVSLQTGATAARVSRRGQRVCYKGNKVRRIERAWFGSDATSSCRVIC